MSAFFVVSTVYAPGSLPNRDYHDLVTNKVREMIAAGKLVKGTLPHATKNSTDGYTNVSDPIGDLVEERPFATNIVLTFNEQTKTFTGGRVPGEPAKFLRIFTSQAAAEEWCEFALQYGAINALILTPEEAAELVDLPPDEVIQQYVVQQ
jgi:hypothetical protein